MPGVLLQRMVSLMVNTSKRSQSASSYHYSFSTETRNKRKPSNVNSSFFAWIVVLLETVVLPDEVQIVPPDRNGREESPSLDELSAVAHNPCERRLLVDIIPLLGLLKPRKTEADVLPTIDLTSVRTRPVWNAPSKEVPT